MFLKYKFSQSFGFLLWLRILDSNEIEQFLGYGRLFFLQVCNTFIV
jgi:hypothetical protein